MLTMAPIVQPYSQDACGIGYGAFSALGWAESRFGIDCLVVYFSIVIVSVTSSLSMRYRLSHRDITSIIASTPISSCLSHTAAGCHFPLVAVVVVNAIVVADVVAGIVVIICRLRHCRLRHLLSRHHLYCCC